MGGEEHWKQGATQWGESAPHLSSSLHLKTEGDRTQTGEGLVNKRNETKKKDKQKEQEETWKQERRPQQSRANFLQKNQVSLLLFFPTFRFNSLSAVYFEFICLCTRDLIHACFMWPSRVTGLG